MLLRFTLDEESKRVYTMNFVDANGKPTVSAHPARFSPDDKFSEERLILKKRFGLLPVDVKGL
jgi:H/ACA ribonucleoprotein complex subunit 3